MKRAINNKKEFLRALRREITRFNLYDIEDNIYADICVGGQYFSLQLGEPEVCEMEVFGAIEPLVFDLEPDEYREVLGALLKFRTSELRVLRKHLKLAKEWNTNKK